MIWFVNLKTANKLIFFFGLMLSMLGLTAWEGASAARAMKANQEATFESDLKTTAYIQRISADRLRIARDVRDGIIETDLGKSAGYMRNVDELERSIRTAIDQADANVHDDAAREALVEVGRSFGEYMAACREAVAASPRGESKGDPPRMLAAIATMRRVTNSSDGRLAAQVDRVWKQAQSRADASQAEYERNVRVSIGLFAAVVIVGGLLTRMISNAIASPLRAAVDVLAQVAKGDLSVRLELDRRDELGELAAALNDSIESMRSTLVQVSAVSTEVSSASSELASNAQAISSGAQEQAASLEETAASLEEISSTVKQNTDNAQEASQLANSARDAAERGGEVVSSAVSAMSEITKSSKKIADIITTIDEIAFQTNLLALNAAVEAARAGEQGRGFGVVAAEVRTLAQRTGTAAKEIRGLIADSSNKVEVGTHQVNESGKTLDEIVRSVKRVTDMVAEIAAASREQNTGLDQVNTAVTQVDQVTQSNAAQTEELSATATSLSDKSTQLQALVSAFELGNGRTREVVKVSAPRASSSRLRAAKSGVVPVASRRAALAPKLAKVANGGYDEF